MTITTTLPELRRGLPLATGTTHKIVLQRIHAYVLELDSGDFHASSSVLLPANASPVYGASTLPMASSAPLAGLRAAFEVGAQLLGRKLIVAGHEGRSANRDGLSKQRAESVSLFLRGERDAWVKGCSRHETRDVQVVLGWAARAHGLACSPGPIDNRLGPRTRDAIARFRTHCNAQHIGTLEHDVPWGELDWGAIYDLYETTLCEELHIDAGGLAHKRASLRFATLPALGCGDRWPPGDVDRDGWRARSSGRVDLLFVEDKPLGGLALDTPTGRDLYEHALGFKKEAWPLAEQPAQEAFQSEFAIDLAATFAGSLTADGFAVWGSLVFGAEVPRSALVRLHSDLRSGSLPNPTYTLSHELDGHLAAYESGTRCIRAHEQLVIDACGEPSLASALACVMVEEFGHYLDDLLRRAYTSIGGDGPQDEGARFACLLLCHQLAGPDHFVVGTYRDQRQERAIRVDWSDLKDQLSNLLGPKQQASDDKTGELEFSDGELGARVTSPLEATEILAIHMLVAGAETADAQVVVALARQLAARLRGEAGSRVLLESTTPGRPAGQVERALLGALLGLYGVLERRLRVAPLSADALPDLGASAWSGEPSATLWDRGSPLSGMVEDISPFGSQQEWLMRYRALEPARAKRRERVEMQWDSPGDGQTRSDFDPVSVAFASDVSVGAHDLVENRAPDSLDDDALNAVDRGLGAVDTVFGLLELVGLEVTGSFGVALAGPVLGIATFLRAMVLAAEQHRRAAEGAGVVFAWFTVNAIARAPEEPPAPLTHERVFREVHASVQLTKLWILQVKYAGSAPDSVDDGITAGIERVLVPLNETLGRVEPLAEEAFERMVLYARFEHLNEAALSKKYPVSWWKLELRRRVFGELAARLSVDASALYARFVPPEDPGNR